MTGRQRVESALARGVMALLGALPAAASARLAGSIARAVGPMLPVSEVARINLRLALPERDEAEHRRIVRRAWWNLGCTVGEMPHLAEFSMDGVAPGYEVDGAEILSALAVKGGPAIFFSGHIGNWELMIPSAAQHGLRPLALFYRAAQNPAVDELISNFRRRAAGGDLTLLPKGTSGARGALAHLAAGGVIGMLADQKMNDGIEATLFGHPAMTAPALAALVLRFRCPLIPTRVERLGPARLRLVLEPPLALPASGDRAHDIAALTQAVNACLERWIRARPEEWLWLHRRFSKDIYRRGRRI
ncbi:MAG: lysophospholipid acyltransferase family protein [Acetobacteraceae bacterium]